MNTTKQYALFWQATVTACAAVGAVERFLLLSPSARWPKALSDALLHSSLSCEYLQYLADQLQHSTAFEEHEENFRRELAYRRAAIDLWRAYYLCLDQAEQIEWGMAQACGEMPTPVSVLPPYFTHTNLCRLTRFIEVAADFQTGWELMAGLSDGILGYYCSILYASILSDRRRKNIIGELRLLRRLSLLYAVRRRMEENRRANA